MLKSPEVGQKVEIDLARIPNSSMVVIPGEVLDIADIINGVRVLVKWDDFPGKIWYAPAELRIFAETEGQE